MFVLVTIYYFNSPLENKHKYNLFILMFIYIHSKQNVTCLQNIEREDKVQKACHRSIARH